MTMSKSAGAATFAMVCLAVLAGAVAPAGASEWCGENGLVRFSFVEGDSLVSVLDGAEPSGGVTRIDLYAWLTDVDRVALDGEVFLALGGFELKLDVQGAEPFIIQEVVPEEGINVGMAPGTLAYGYTSGQRLRDGRAPLVHWQLMFQGTPSNVRFGLDAAGSMSCQRDEGCRQAAPPAVYIGAATSNQLNTLVGAGYVPAWLNPVGECDQTPVRGGQSWQEVGLFEAKP